MLIPQNGRHWDVGVLGVLASACLMGASTGGQPSNAGTPIHFASVTMESSTVGWGIDRHLGGQLVHTIDDGRTWANVTPPGVTFDEVTSTTPNANVPPSPPHNTVTWYQSGAVAKTVTLLSRSADGTGVVLVSETADGGREWHRWRSQLPKLNAGALLTPTLDQLDFTGAGRGWLVAGPGYGSAAGMDFVGMELWRTTNGGHTWTQVDEISGSSGIMVGALTFNSATSGWLMESTVNHSPILLHSTDAGHTWSRVRLAGMAPDSIPIFDGTHGILFVSKDDRLDHLDVMKSRDAGQHWGPAQTVPLPTSTFVGVKVAANDPNVLWDLSGHTLWRSINGGQTWTVQSQSSVLIHNPFLDVVNRHAIWAWDATVGNPSTMASSINGGQSWMSWTPMLTS